MAEDLHGILERQLCLSLVIIIQEIILMMLSMIFPLKEDRTISSNSGFNGFYSKFEDLGLYVSSDIIKNLDEYDIDEFSKLFLK